MTQVKAFRNKDGTVGIRQHVFVLPSVVCANQVAIDVATSHSGVKYIEHQHGCAQVGADLTQTSRVFSQLALHPNVLAAAFVGLGCEGILTRELFERTQQRTSKPMGLFVIQELGNTGNTSASVEAWIDTQTATRGTAEAVEVSPSALRIGLIADEGVPLQGPGTAYLLRGLAQMGFQWIVPNGVAEEVSALLGVTDGEVLAYGAPASTSFARMDGGSNQLELCTGLAAAGAHLVIHLSLKPHAFGSPVVPLVRFCIDEALYQGRADDFDGRLVTDMDGEEAVACVLRIAEGEPCVAEDMGLDDFAMYRIGPTV